MYVLTDCVSVRHRVNHAVAEIIGMRTCKTNSTNSVDISNGTEQICEIVTAVVIRIHCLPEQHDFSHSFTYNIRGFAHDVIELPASLGTTSGRHDAIRAAIVASALNRDPRLYLVEPPRFEILVMLFEIKRR